MAHSCKDEEAEPELLLCDLGEVSLVLKIENSEIACQKLFLCIYKKILRYNFLSLSANFSSYMEYL